MPLIVIPSPFFSCCVAFMSEALPFPNWHREISNHSYWTVPLGSSVAKTQQNPPIFKDAFSVFSVVSAVSMPYHSVTNDLVSSSGIQMEQYKLTIKQPLHPTWPSLNDFFCSALWCILCSQFWPLTQMKSYLHSSISLFGITAIFHTNFLPYFLFPEHQDIRA